MRARASPRRSARAPPRATVCRLSLKPCSRVRSQIVPCFKALPAAHCAGAHGHDEPTTKLVRRLVVAVLPVYCGGVGPLWLDARAIAAARCEAKCDAKTLTPALAMARRCRPPAVTVKNCDTPL